MAGERWADRIVETLAAYVRANLPTQLRAVETAQSLTAGSLTDPMAVVEARVPDDGRSPLVEVYDIAESWQIPGAQRVGVFAVTCEIAIVYSGDADLEAGELFMRRYRTALIDLLRTNSTLGNQQVQVRLLKGDVEAVRGSNATTHHAYVLTVEVLALQEATT